MTGYEPHLPGKHKTRGYNMCLQSGKPFFPLDPHPNEIDIEDIAHALSMIPRYGGHTKEFYSVAQHSILCSQIVEPKYKLEALLHDAAEAYIGDLVRPVKASLTEWADIERKVEHAIRRKYDLPLEMSEAVKLADDCMFATERRDLLPDAPNVDWGPFMPEPHNVRVFPWSWKVAKHEFLLRFSDLMKESEEADDA